MMADERIAQDMLAALFRRELSTADVVVTLSKRDGSFEYEVTAVVDGEPSLARASISGAELKGNAMEAIEKAASAMIGRLKHERGER